MRHSSRWDKTIKKKTDDEMIKHDHENELFQTISAKNKFESHFSNHISHFETERKTRYQHTFAAIRLQNLIKSYKKERLLRAKKLIIVMFSKKSNSQTKRLFLFIIVCYLKSLNTIQFFREVKKRNRLTLKDFYHIFQDVIAARQKDFELDSDYNFFSFKLFSSVISNQFFRKSIFDSFSDIDLFDLEVRSFFSFNKHVSFKQFISKQIVNLSRT
jgi:hypothetical protein